MGTPMRRQLVPALLLLTSLPAIASAQLTPAGSRGALTGGTFNWTSIDPGSDLVVVGASASGVVGGVSFTVSRPAGDDMLLVSEGVDFDGMFASGERILFSGFDDQPLTFSFASSITGFGAAIQSNVFGPFIGQAEFFDGATSLGAVTVSATTAGGSTNTAPFLGATSAAAFNRVVVSAPVNGAAGLAMNAFSIQRSTVVPEPSTYALLGTGLIALVAVARRHRQC
jgi:hypothetical protein